jgi:tRNA nucleotidyltransferase/poly(A) polymerase
MPRIAEVGGCVRDGLLGVKSKDIDFTFVLDNLDQTVDQGFTEMEQWMTDRGFKIFVTKPDMFTIRAKFPTDSLHAGLDADFVMARKETGYVPGTRTPILELGTLEDDLVRRDFTLNAMARDEDGTLIDLFGGQEDLKNGMLRTPLDPKITLMDDPLRIMRALRFSITRGFDIHPNVYQAMEQPEILEKLRVTVSAERIRDELYKMMKHDTPKTIRRLEDIDQHCIPGFLDLVFGRGLWLEPTFKK